MSLPFKNCETCPLLINCKGENPHDGLSKFIESNPHFRLSVGSSTLPGISYNASFGSIDKVYGSIDPLFAEGNPSNLDSRTANLTFNCVRATISARLMIEANFNNAKIQTADAEHRNQILRDLRNL